MGRCPLDPYQRGHRPLWKPIILDYWKSVGVAATPTFPEGKLGNEIYDFVFITHSELF